MPQDGIRTPGSLEEELAEARTRIDALTCELLSSRQAADATQQTLLYELQHRVRNILAAVGSLSSRMLRFNPSNKDFSAALLARLRAMGMIHEILARSGWESADLGELIAAVLAPYGTIEKGNLVLNGPCLPLRSGMASTLGMATHELAANAARYGAWSQPAGQVAVMWRIETKDGGRRLIADWRETGGPVNAGAPEERFGIEFIRRSIDYELDGIVVFDFQPAGLTVGLEIPLGTV